MTDAVTDAELASVPPSRVYPARLALSVRLDPSTIAWLNWRSQRGGMRLSTIVRRVIESAVYSDAEWQALRAQYQKVRP